MKPYTLAEAVIAAHVIHDAQINDSGVRLIRMAGEF